MSRIQQPVVAVLPDGKEVPFDIELETKATLTSLNDAEYRQVAQRAVEHFKIVRPRRSEMTIKVEIYHLYIKDMQIQRILNRSIEVTPSYPELDWTEYQAEMLREMEDIPEPFQKLMFSFAEDAGRYGYDEKLNLVVGMLPELREAIKNHDRSF